MMTSEHHRKNERAALDLYVNKIVGDEPHLVRIRDISESGVYFYKLLEPEINSSEFVGLEMKLPNSEEVIWAVGEVVRLDKRNDNDGTAVRFVRISESDRRIISDYIISAGASATCAA
ncbi:MAG: PilZ domain-containing protein [Deltaproteobacteria bacterium]|nr:PilZ domain-containing protein [Deltaproteobacteria bacterium]